MKPTIFLIALFFGINTLSIGQTIEDSSRDLLFSTYMKAQIQNDVPTLAKLIARDAAITIPGKLGQMQVSKSDFLQLIRQSGMEQQLCSPSYETLTASADRVSARVNFMYSSYAIENVIKAEKKGGAWKIVELQKTFKSTSDAVVVMQ